MRKASFLVLSLTAAGLKKNFYQYVKVVNSYQEKFFKKNVPNKGCLVTAKTEGLISEVTPLLDALLFSVFRMSDGLYRRGRMLAGEI
jgi:hypothetical protein